MHQLSAMALIMLASGCRAVDQPSNYVIPPTWVGAVQSDRAQALVQMLKADGIQAAVGDAGHGYTNLYAPVPEIERARDLLRRSAREEYLKFNDPGRIGCLLLVDRQSWIRGYTLRRRSRARSIVKRQRTTVLA